MLGLLMVIALFALAFVALFFLFGGYSLTGAGITAAGGSLLAVFVDGFSRLSAIIDHVMTGNGGTGEMIFVFGLGLLIVVFVVNAVSTRGRTIVR